MAQRHICLGLVVLASLLAFWGTLTTLIRFSLEYEHYSHIALIPFVSVGLLWMERKRIFATVQWSYGMGSALLLIGVILYGLARMLSSSLSPNDYLSLAILSLVMIWLGGFVLCYGREAFRAACFPLLFLLFVVPIPEWLLEKTIRVLQEGSAEVTYGIFKLTGVPIYREGLLFSLPGLDIEIAKECSGIRSSLALLITSLLAGHFFLRAGWVKGMLILAAFPIALLKNGLRIAVISLLSIYVDPGFLTGPLHRSGGILFFALSLGLLALVLRWMQRSEKALALKES